MRPTLLTALASFLLLGCTHNEPKPQTGPTPAAHNEAPAPAPAAAPAPTAEVQKKCNVDLDCGDRQLCLHGTCTDITADLAECNDVRVHFDFNEAVIREGDRAPLERVARCLKADRGAHVMIEGSADERGTEEYNLALGDQRAKAVEQYLGSLGVGEQQLRTVSYGEERPVCTEHDEACWSKNRRAGIQRQPR